MKLSQKKQDFLCEWHKAGGLITHKIAAAINGIDTSQITRRIQKGELTEHIYEGTKLVSLKEALEVKRKRQQKAHKP